MPHVTTGLALLVSTITVVSGFLTLAGVIWRAASRWTHVSDTLASVIEQKEKDHERMLAQLERLEARIERHEAWHQDRPGRR